MSFENATPDAVTVYVLVGSTSWSLGNVSPGRASQLRIPGEYSARTDGSVMLVAVPVGARVSDSRITTLADAVHSDPLDSDMLTRMRWRLIGRTLASLRR